jgi:predicted Rossmann fold nucleotide-binding protein DprA/Smf involved in DNA uptake
MDENKQAILLLAAQFSAPGKGAPTPLTALEYGRFAARIKQVGFQPRDLFHQFDEVLAKWQDPKKKVTAQRLQYLLGRGMAMGMAIEKWQSAGIWILTRADNEYPRRLKKHLGEAAPALLFGVGEKALLSAGGLAMVGSRKIGASETEFTRQVAKQAALEGMNLVSGGARGVDETAMVASLEIEGTAVGVLANDLFKSAVSGKWRKYLKNSQLALISPFYPEARFHVGTAMGRNKYIYCLSDYALVVRSEKDTGGTWAGATENLKEKNGWAPLFVASPSNADGNVALKEMGARPLVVPESGNIEAENWLSQQLGGQTEDRPQPSTPENPTAPDRVEEKINGEPPPVKDASSAEKDDVAAAGAADREVDVAEGSLTLEPEPSFDEFMQYVSEQLIEKGEVKFSDLKEQRKDLKQKQIREWLDQAVNAGLLNRKGRLLSYTSNSSGMDQQGFNFE